MKAEDTIPDLVHSLSQITLCIRTIISLFHDNLKTTNVHFYFQWALEKGQIQKYKKISFSDEVFMIDFKLL